MWAHKGDGTAWGRRDAAQIRSFPDMLVAGWGGFRERGYYNPPVTIPGAP